MTRIEYISDPDATPDAVRGVYGPEDGCYRVVEVASVGELDEAISAARKEGLGALMLLNAGDEDTGKAIYAASGDIVPKL